MDSSVIQVQFTMRRYLLLLGCIEGVGCSLLLQTILSISLFVTWFNSASLCKNG